MNMNFNTAPETSAPTISSGYGQRKQDTISYFYCPYNRRMTWGPHTTPIGKSITLG